MLVIDCYKIVAAFIVYCCLLAGWFLVLQTSVRYDQNWILPCNLYVMPCLCGTRIYHTRLVRTATYTFLTLLVKQKYYIQK